MHVCVCSRLFTSLFVRRGCRATEQTLPLLPRHTATELLPEIFNRGAAVNGTPTLESMSLSTGREGNKEMGFELEDGHMSWKRESGLER